MNPSFRTGAIAGFVAGSAFIGVVLMILTSRPAPVEPRPKPPEPSASQDRVRELEEDNRRLSKKLADLERAKPSDPSPAPKAEKPVEAAPPDLKERVAKLAEAGLAAFQSPDFAETLKAVKESGKPAIELLAGLLRSSASATERLVAAALLGGAADPSALPALVDALKSDKDLFVRRTAASVIAVLANSAGEEPLRAAMTGDADWGVRVNSAYGLAKLKQDDGLRLLQQSYESSDTPAEYRIPILGGLADVAAPATAPLFRRILTDSKDETYLILAIMAVEKMKDTDSLPVLQQVLASTQPDFVKQAATKAIDSIRK